MQCDGVQTTSAWRELRLVFPVVNFLEDVLESPIIGFEDRVLRREIERPASSQAVVEAGVGEVADRCIEVVHSHRHPGAGEVEHVEVELLPVGADPLHRQLARPWNEEIGRAILVAESVTADHDRVGPAGDETRHVGDDNGLAEDAAAEDVADRAVRRLPHLLEVEFLNSRFVRRDGRAFDADAMFLDRMGGIDSDLVVRCVAVFDREVVVQKVDVEIRLDQPLPDPLPDDPRHLVAIELDDGVFHLDLGHAFSRILEFAAP